MATPAQNIRNFSESSSGLRTPPQSVDTEKALLGALLLDGGSFQQVVDLMDDSSFYRPAHGVIFKAMHDLYYHHEPVDIVSVAEQLKREGKLEEIGGQIYLIELGEISPSAANIEYYAKVVHEKAILRQLISFGTKISTQGYDSASRPDEVFEYVQKELSALFKLKRGQHAKTMSDVMHETFQFIENLKSQQNYVSGLSSGFDRLDDFTTGFKSGEFIIIAARPSMGKTSLAMNIAANVVKKHQVPVAVFSLEMDARQLTMRMLSGETNIDLHRLNQSTPLRHGEYSKLVTTVSELAELPIYFDDTAGLSLEGIRSRARQLAREKQIKMILIDYLGLIMPAKAPDNLQQWIAHVSASLKALAKELELPVICLSQLSRAPETRGGEHKPVLSDLRDSGAIEQDADVVMFVYRPEVYKDAYKNKKYEFNNKQFDVEGLAEVIIAKNRNGPTGSILLTWLAKFTKFANFAEDIPPSTRSAIDNSNEDDIDGKPF